MLRARKLRREATDAERLLWHQLRSRGLCGWKFRRQYIIGWYIVDFVCLSARLVVEVDGGQHADDEAYDERRTACLERLGFRVLRFWCGDVLRETDAVLEAIATALGPSAVEPGDGLGTG